MSVVATVKVFDGIVIGAESMTQLFQVNQGGQPQFIKSYSNAQKIFQVASFPVGALTYGAGNIGNRSMESLVHEFSRAEEQAAPGAPRSVEAITGRLFTFMHQYYDPVFGALPQEQRPRIGFYLAGYSPGLPLGSEWEFVIPDHQQPIRARDDNQVGASWRGVSVPFSRLFFGIDPRVEQILANIGIPQPQILQMRQQIATQLLSKVAFEGMPLRDAIGFCKFIIDTTIGAATYEIGNPSCGGPVNIAVIHQEESEHREEFEWISKPELTV